MIICLKNLLTLLATMLVTTSFVYAEQEAKKGTVNVKQKPQWMENRASDESPGFSDWMITRRKGDPLASQGANRIYFREKRVGLEVDVDPNALRAEGTNATNNRAKVRVLTRYRSVPLDQALPNRDFILDITGEYPHLQPQFNGKNFYFRPIGETNSKAWTSSGWQDVGKPPPSSNDIVIEVPKYAPWVTTNLNGDAKDDKTMMDWAISQVNRNGGAKGPSKVNAVVLVDATTRTARGGGKFSVGKDFVGATGGVSFDFPGGVVLNVWKLAEHHRDSGAKGLVIAVRGANRTLITGGQYLAGPLQIVSDSHTVIVGDLGYSKENWDDKGIPTPAWVNKNARWRLLCPEFSVASAILSLQELLDGEL